MDEDQLLIVTTYEQGPVTTKNYLLANDLPHLTKRTWGPVAYTENNSGTDPARTKVWRATHGVGSAEIPDLTHSRWGVGVSMPTSANFLIPMLHGVQLKPCQQAQ